jgi:probable rRNA maturation factor
MEISVSNPVECKVNINLIKNIAISIIEEELEKNDNYYLEIILTDDIEIQKLNKEYRNVDSPTDVLTFVYDKPILGEIYISCQRIEEQSKKFSTTFNEELTYILIHGLLHICGYDHEKDESFNEPMFDLQKKYFNRLKNLL